MSTARRNGDDGAPRPATVLVAHDGPVAILILNRAHRANLINLQLARELRAGFRALVDDDTVRAIVLTANGDHFSAGDDPGAPPAAPVPPTPDPVDVSWVPKPIIAAVNGPALGRGCELALACDIRFLASKASIGLDEISGGRLPRSGGMVRLARLVGPSQAKRLVLAGEPVEAREAQRIGLADRVCAPESLVAEATAFAARLARHRPDLVTTAKTIIDQSLELDLHRALDLDRRLQATLEPARTASTTGSGTAPPFDLARVRVPGAAPSGTAGPGSRR